MAVAHDVARRSLCTRAQVGCVIVTSENRVVAVSYNGPPAGFPHEQRPCVEWCPRAMIAASPLAPACPPDPGYDDCPALHAEANGLSVCDRSLREGGTLYVTGDVCYACAKLVANSGLSYVVVDRSDPREYRRSGRSYELLKRCGVEVIEWEG